MFVLKLLLLWGWKTVQLFETVIRPFVKIIRRLQEMIVEIFEEWSDPKWNRRQRIGGRGFDVDPESMLSKDILGRQGEQVAVKFLRKNGYRILATNLQIGDGEVDIIAQDRAGVIVFVEVKTRRTRLWGEPYEAVNQRKRRGLCLMSEEYLRQRDWQGKVKRLDIISIVWPENEEPEINHVMNAFDGSELCERRKKGKRPFIMYP
ncbi:MAG: YraN family protein [Thermoguttaceae bacterium]